jgi:type I restriction enzyme S subunit
MIKELTMEKTSLPIGWETKILGEACEILDNLRKPITKRDRIEGKYPYYGATGILSYINDYIFDEKLVLIGEDGAKWFSGANSSFIVNGKYWVNNHAHVIRPNRNIILDEWIVYFLNFSDLEEFVTGMTVPKLNQGNLKIIPIPLPPLPQQKQIIATLDKAFAAIDTAKANAVQNLQNAKELFESYLQNVFENKGDDWEKGEFGNIITTLTDYHANGSYKILKKNVELKDTDDYAWMIRSTDFEKKFKNSFKYIDEHAYNFMSKSKVLGNEIIMSKIGNAGKVYLMPKVDRPTSLAMNLFLIRLDENKTLPEFIFRFLKSKKGESQIQKRVKGATTKTITKDNVRNIIISFPSIVEQKIIIKKLDSLSAETNKLEAIYIQKIADLEEMKKSVLQKAFSGQLNTIN